ncbi:MAG: Hsp70 family protein, partial [Shewanella sp.]
SYQLVRLAETAKIALSEQECTAISLDVIEKELSAQVSRGGFEQAIEPSLAKIEALMHQALAQASATLATSSAALAADKECQADLIYVTGGTARSPAIYDKIASIYPEVPVVVGDHFGSVTAGLTRWAHTLFAKS